jgi:uncharacterized protein (DUF2252 family)
MKLPTTEERAAILDAKRTLKMARSAHAYVRGNTANFYDWLADSAAAKLVPVGPAIWICGDCHLGNLGPLADDDGNVAVQIRDLDQAVIGNPAHDLIRLGLSLATAARGSDLPGVTTAHMIEAMIDGYETAMADPDGEHDGPEPDVVRSIRRRALGRRWRHLARERLDGVQPTIPLGRKFWPIDERERTALTALFAETAIRDLTTSIGLATDGNDVALVDAAYWMKGCSSLGLLRFAAIVALRAGKGRARYALVDIKEAVDPIAPVAKGTAMPVKQADRVVAAARALSPYLGTRIAAADLLGRSVFVRELAPQDLKLEVDQFNRSEAIRAARYLAFVVGKAHARQLSADLRHDWYVALQAGRTSSIDAPSWLWESIVALAARHEAGYLEHCRRYAIATNR